MSGSKLSQYVEELIGLSEGMADRELVDTLRPLLDSRPVAPLVEYLAERLDCDDGERQMRFELSNGNLRRSRFGHEPVGVQELEHLARVG
jgi:hypothetical protein